MLQVATGSTTPRQLASRFNDQINVRDYGAKGDGATDDTMAFDRAIAAATNVTAPRAHNTGAKIYVPCGKYILTARLVVTMGPNAAIGFYGDTASCSELQWNVRDGGLDFELPHQTMTSPSRSLAGASSGLGAAVDVEHLSFVNNAPGDVYTGIALRINQPIPTNSIASGGPDQTISDVRWYSLAPGLGGVSGQGQNWRIGIEIAEAPYTHIDHVTGTQWSNKIPYGPPDSAGIHIVSNGSATDYFQQQVWLTNYSQQGAYRGLAVDGHNLQGLYASGLFLLENALAIDWEAPAADASASFTLTGSSLDGAFGSIRLMHVRQVMISNTEILSPGNYGVALPGNYYGILDAGADNVMLSNNVIIPACGRCTPGLFAPGFKSYGILVNDQVPDDGQGSVISNNTISSGDVGIQAEGGQILVVGNSISGAVPVPLLDGQPGAPSHPNFQANLWGSRVVSSAMPVNAGITYFGPRSSYTTSALPNSDAALFACTGTVSSLNFNLPGNPINGQTMTIGAECNVASLRFIPQPEKAGITVIGAPTSLTPSTPVKLIYDAATRIWLPWR